jgi:hypothetical protein
VINIILRGMIKGWYRYQSRFPHRHQTYGYEWSISVEDSASETPTNLSSLNVDIFQTTINSWGEVTSWGSREAWYRVIRVLPRWQISLWHFRCLRMVKIDVITYKYMIKHISTRFVWSNLLQGQKKNANSLLTKKIKSYFLQWNKKNSYLCIGHHLDS